MQLRCFALRPNLATSTGFGLPLLLPRMRLAANVRKVIIEAVIKEREEDRCSHYLGVIWATPGAHHGNLTAVGQSCVGAAAVEAW